MSRDVEPQPEHCGGHRCDRLAVLPDEVLLRLFEAVGRISLGDLSRVSQLNRKYHGLADLLLYKSVRFDRPEFHVIFSESLNRRPRRGSAIQDITLEYPSSELSRLALNAPLPGSHFVPGHGLSRTISAMSNLEKLDIAVPDTLLHGIGTLFNGPFDLACLKSCTLFYQCSDDQYWDLQENIHIFSHPTLESLVIRRAKLDSRGFVSIERPHETALKKLHLIECDINDDALSDVLEFPEGLTEFVMTQLPEPSPPLEESTDNIGDYIIALSSQGPTLETVTIDFPTLTGRRPLRMRDFEVLKTLRINWDYQLFGKSSKKPRMHSVGLPPELETLEFFNELGSDEVVTDLLAMTIQTKNIIARKWKSMIVMANDDGKVPQEIIDACKEQGLDLDIMGQIDSDTDGEEEIRPQFEREVDQELVIEMTMEPEPMTPIEAETVTETKADREQNAQMEIVETEINNQPDLNFKFEMENEMNTQPNLIPEMEIETKMNAQPEPTGEMETETNLISELDYKIKVDTISEIKTKPDPMAALEQGLGHQPELRID
jgi:hypothetical protein